MSIERTKYGTFRVKYYTKDGKGASKTFKRRTDADVFDQEQAKLKWSMPAEEIKSPKGESTFRDFSETWLKNHASVHKAFSTVVRDTQVIRDHFFPLFGDWHLSELSFANMVELQAHLRNDKKLSPKTVNNIMGLLKKMLTDAVYWDELEKNPAEKLRPLKVVQEEMKFWTFSERDRFLNFCKSRHRQMWLCVLISVYTGIRRGELQALKRGSLDFDRREILISHSFCLVKKEDVTTKSKKSRRVEMNELVFEALQDKRLLAPDQRIITQSIHNLVENSFKSMCRRAGVPVIRWHDMRHTFASHCVMSGIPIYTVQDLLGHSSVSTTQRYAHLSPSAKKGITDRIIAGDKAETRQVLEVLRESNGKD